MGDHGIKNWANLRDLWETEIKDDDSKFIDFNKFVESIAVVQSVIDEKGKNINLLKRLTSNENRECAKATIVNANSIAEVNGKVIFH